MSVNFRKMGRSLVRALEQLDAPDKPKPSKAPAAEDQFSKFPASNAQRGVPAFPAPRYDEATSKVVLDSAFQGMFGRAPTDAERQKYQGFLGFGRLSYVLDQMVSSDEWKQRKAFTDPATISTQLYTAILGREPDPGGHAATIDALTRGDGGLRVFDMIISPENTERLANLSAAPTPEPTPEPTPTPPTPPTTPTPAAGKDAIDLSQAQIFNSPQDVASWPVTTTIKSLDFNDKGPLIEFDKKDGANRWPDVPFGAPGDSLQYTVWMAVKQDGKWQTSGGIEYWNGLDRNGGPPAEFGQNWYYDSSRWGSMANYQPKPGEEVGFFVTAGDARNNGNALVKERSNIVTLPFPGSPNSHYSF